MTDSTSVTFAMFQEPEKASLAQAYLAEHGIHSELLGDVIGTTLSYIGTATGGIRLQGLSVDAEKAVELLNEIKQGQPANKLGQWVCSNCGETVDAGFEVCWSCNEMQTEDAVLKHAPPQNDSQLEGEVSTDESTEEMMNRAWKGAILGIAFFPILIYTAYLLLKLSIRAGTENYHTKFYISWGIVLIMSFFYYVLLFPNYN